MFEAVRDISLRTIALVAVVVWATLAAVWFLSLGSGSPAQPAPDRVDTMTKKPPAVGQAMPAASVPAAVRQPAPSTAGAGQDVVVSTAPEAAGEPVPTPASPKRGFALQAGAFQSAESARALLGRIRGDGFPGFLQPPAPGESLYRVMVGPFADRAQAKGRQAALESRGVETFVKSLDR